MKQTVIIEVRGGAATYQMGTSKNINVVIIDHDNPSVEQLSLEISLRRQQKIADSNKSSQFSFRKKLCKLPITYRYCSRWGNRLPSAQ